MRRSGSNLTYFRNVASSFKFYYDYFWPVGGGGRANLQSMGKSTILLNPIFKPIG